MRKNKKLVIAIGILGAITLIGSVIYVICCQEKKANTPEKNIKVSQEKLHFPQHFVVWQPNKDSEPFFVKKIWDEHKVKSCVECHDNQKSLANLRGKKRKKAHWDIAQAHGKAQLMKCNGCHDEKKVWRFKANQEFFGANMSVKTCAQCHFGEKKDWEMGAHGKRVSGWKKQRAVMHCTHCHDPHQPAIHKKWPSIAPKRPLH